MSMPGLATTKSPSVTLPLRHIATGIAAYLIFHLALVSRGPIIAAGQFSHPATVTAVHIGTLGWVTMVIMGAMYQMVPVLLQARLYSESLGFGGYWLFLVGVSSLVTGFWTSQPVLIVMGGAAAATAIYLFVFNMTLTLREVRGGGVHGWAVAGAVTFLFLTATWGLLLVTGMNVPLLGDAFVRFMAAHAIFGLAGWFSLSIFGVGYRLVPMFALSHGHPENRQGVAVLLLGAGAGSAGAVAILGITGPVAALAGLPVVAAFVIFALDVAAIIRHRRRRKMELVTRFSLASVAFGVFAGAMAWAGGMGWRPPWLETGAWVTAIVFTALAGWVSFMVVGQIFKIVPFLVWLQRYSDKAGREAVPLVRDLYDPRLGEASLILLGTGTVGTILSILSGASGVAAFTNLISLAGAGFFAFAMLQALMGRREIPRKRA